MKNTKKLLLLLSTSALLVGCSAEVKQKQIAAEDAKVLAETIYDYIDDHYLEVELPSEFTITSSNSSESHSDDGTGKKLESSFEGSNKYIYSTKQKMFYTKSEHVNPVENYSFESWLFIEGDVAYMYTIQMYDDEPVYSVESTDENLDTVMKEFAQDAVLLENADVIVDYIDDFYFTDVTPDMGDEVPVGSEITYSSYYGSDNEKSAQFEESLKVVAPEFTQTAGKFKGEEKITSKINIKNYLVYSLENTFEMTTTSLEGKGEMGQSGFYKWNLVEKAEKIPTLDKTLFKE